MLPYKKMGCLIHLLIKHNFTVIRQVLMYINKNGTNIFIRLELFICLELW